jgi:hypothetical protein
MSFSDHHDHGLAGRLTSMTDHTRYPDEDQIEELFENSSPVYAMHWDSGAPGMGASTECVFRWGNGYLVFVSWEFDENVYPTLRAAIDAYGIDGVGEHLCAPVRL